MEFCTLATSNGSHVALTHLLLSFYLRSEERLSRVYYTLTRRPNIQFIERQYSTAGGKFDFRCCTARNTAPTPQTGELHHHTRTCRKHLDISVKSHHCMKVVNTRNKTVVYSKLHPDTQPMLSTCRLLTSEIWLESMR